MTYIYGAALLKIWMKPVPFKFLLTNVGHMAPNEVINRQFGRLTQMETFLMSNMSPQYGSLNSGVLGIGREERDNLFDHETGIFNAEAVAQLDKLEHMEVELEGGPGTALSHWDEDKFDLKLMTGYQDHGEYVPPVTIELMEVFGHTVNELLNHKTDMSELLQEAASVVFSRQDEARSLDLEHFENTELFESIPHLRN